MMCLPSGEYARDNTERVCPLDLPTAPLEPGMPRPVLQSEILSTGTLARCRLLPTLPMAGISSPGPTTAAFKTGMPRLALQLESPSEGTPKRCCPLPTLPMGATSSPHPPATPFESGMLRLVLQSEIFPRSILCGVRPLLTLLMGGTSPLPPTASFKYGMPRPVLQSEILSRGTRLGYRPLLTLPMGGTSFLDPMTAPLESGMHRLVLPPANLSIEGHTFPVQSIVSSSHKQHIVPGSSDSVRLPVHATYFHDVFPSDLPPVLQSILIFVHRPTSMVGSGTQKVAYYTGYPTTAMRVCIHLAF